MKNIFINNLGLKLLALFLAIMTWTYIVAELQKGTLEEHEALQNVLPFRMVSKRLPVKLNLIGMPPHGYTVGYDEATINPSEIVIIGPWAVLNRLKYIETQPIDIAGASKTFSKDVSIIPPTKGFIKEKFITVTVPIIRSVN